MTEDEERRLLEAARTANEAVRQAQGAMTVAAAERADAVRACMEAGIPRQRIAETLGVNRSILYRLTRRDQPV
ncbi:helix-turn-helix domain-containing protein [uncultured Actinomyces sp.]|uniref:helix-turn-helix domain-containing protein n=1 Tax=uncultured Actinomyces sp. TaxID=249061 RepID=UPI0028E9CC1C|nr:helix-turn-helix domain-containing protein [uncultured Actinomyces sp.]